jgi:hypothetical protein
MGVMSKRQIEILAGALGAIGIVATVVTLVMVFLKRV